MTDCFVCKFVKTERVEPYWFKFNYFCWHPKVKKQKGDHVHGRTINDGNCKLFERKEVLENDNN